MNKLLKLLSALTFLAFSGMPSKEGLIERNIKVAPICCSKQMEYLGEHSGQRLNTQFYQCQSCKRLELLHKHDWEKS